MLLEIEKTLVEGAGAAGLAALLQAPASASPAARSGWCCAAATSTRCCWPRSSSAAWCAPGRLARMRVGARDVPGSLAEVTAHASADAGANIDEVHHQRAFTMLAAQNVEIEAGGADPRARSTCRRCWTRCTRPASRPSGSERAAPSAAASPSV